MSNQSFMDRIYSFFGFNEQPLRNEFRNPIWLSDDDDDDGDELYGRRQRRSFEDLFNMHKEMAKNMEETMKIFGMIGDFTSIGDNVEAPKGFADDASPNQRNSLRDYYLKPGYHNSPPTHKDMDLDGQITSNDISGFLAPKSPKEDMWTEPLFSGDKCTAKSYFQTVITTKVMKPDGTVETRKVVKNSDGTVEDTTTTETPKYPKNVSISSSQATIGSYKSIFNFPPFNGIFH